MVEQPVKAVILLFPLSDLLEVKRKEEDLRFKAQAQSLLSSVFWIKQTVRLHSRIVQVNCIQVRCSHRFQMHAEQ